jgi:hypothetical protein
MNDMKPKFKNLLAWEQAQLLMQPAFLRVLDNIRKQLELSAWKGTFEEVETPMPGYRLHLIYGDRSVTIDIWDLCFQICFLHYPPLVPDANPEIDIDTALLDETGDVDWQSLETKAQRVIQRLFASLPPADAPIED